MRVRVRVSVRIRVRNRVRVVELTFFLDDSVHGDPLSTPLLYFYKTYNRG